MIPPINPNQIVANVTAALDQCKISYMIVGSFCSNVYGVERTTQDADFVIKIDDLPIATLASALGPDFKIDPQSRIESFTMGTYYTIAHLRSNFYIDLFLLKNDPHDQSSFERRILAPSSGKIFLSTPEDLIITKLRWSQNGRRNKDIDDARNVLAVQQPQNLNLAYIRHWTAQHQTLPLFESLLAATPII